ncbi:hypothetical protein CTEN210_02425 [Chaetoceros tenuissimus]|uniref:Uncharacterized protein n=1 Tax=Chaetoceros tenuissimus TaxID=426638 RepID=A0AAD3CJD6_9STRA|nr:hypothetical protein CTEN210_02425 [Chaetoceros tenuissimus]
MAKNSNKRKRNTDEDSLKKPKPSHDEKSSTQSGLDDIDDLFASKKEREIEQKKRQKEEERVQTAKKEFFKKNAQTSEGASLAKAKKKSLVGDKSDVQDVKKNEWVNDGLGGVFDRDGYTGRKEDGMKVYKAHLFNKKGFGTTPDCPFDCQCCFI